MAEVSSEGGVGSTLAGSEVFQRGSDPAQTRLYGFSRSPKKACWVCLCPKACTHNAGVTPRVALAPGLSSAIPVLGKTAIASAARCRWWVKSPVFSGGCSKPFQLGRLLRRGGRCPRPPLSAPRPTRRVGRWATEGCGPRCLCCGPPRRARPAGLPIRSHQRPSVGAQGCVPIPVFPWDPRIPPPAEELQGPRSAGAPPHPWLLPGWHRGHV